MKIKKAFRINEELSNEVKAMADINNISYSQFIELSLYYFLENNPPNNKYLLSKENERKFIHFTLEVNANHLNKLKKIASKKNSTLSQEIRYRLSATLDSPVFSDNEFSTLMKTRADLNRLGNLLKLAINNDNDKVIDNELLVNIGDEISNLKSEWYDVLVKAKLRQL